MEYTKLNLTVEVELWAAKSCTFRYNNFKNMIAGGLNSSASSYIIVSAFFIQGKNYMSAIESKLEVSSRQSNKSVVVGQV